jgi:ABC-2 type transport system ATP-binding protein
MPALEVTDLRKRYGRVRALQGVSFSVAPGEIFGYLGPNGAGKTTTLRILTGLVRADGGTVRLLGDATGHARVRERVGYLPGELRLYGDMTARAALEHLARYRPSRPPVLRERLLAAFGLGADDLARRVKFLSHGTKQKVGLVIALQHDPDLLLLDEPTNGLDPLVQRAFREVLLERSRAGRAALLSSHVLSEVEAVCARVAILRAGSVVTEASVADLRARMVRRATVRFRGAAPAGLAALPGVERVQAEGAETVLWVRGDANPLLRALAGTEVEHFVFPEPQLEDIFLGYYERGAADHA